MDAKWLIAAGIILLGLVGAWMTLRQLKAQIAFGPIDTELRVTIVRLQIACFASLVAAAGTVIAYFLSRDFHWTVWVIAGLCLLYSANRVGQARRSTS